MEKANDKKDENKNVKEVVSYNLIILDYLFLTVEDKIWRPEKERQLELVNQTVRVIDEKRLYNKTEDGKKGKRTAANAELEVSRVGCQERMKPATDGFFLGRRECNYPDYYNVLGCDRCSTKSQIMAEYRWRIRQLHPDKSSDQVSEVFHEIQNAKNILANDEARRTYDAWLDCSVDIPWSLWLKNFGSLPGVHWTCPIQTMSVLKYGNEKTKMENSCKRHDVISAQAENAVLVK
uniref:J domain-containing protein n=1 Tax=Setaria digitata TaxID=48799 RepID=A0A915Q320_9BILA